MQPYYRVCNRLAYDIAVGITRTHLTFVRRTNVLKLNAISFNNIARLTFVNSNKVRAKIIRGDVCLMRYVTQRESQQRRIMINYDTTHAVMELVTGNN